jgi:predicted PurR-regulated permease PerM
MIVVFGCFTGIISAVCSLILTRMHNLGNKHLVKGCVIVTICSFIISFAFAYYLGMFTFNNSMQHFISEHSRLEIEIETNNESINPQDLINEINEYNNNLELQQNRYNGFMGIRLNDELKLQLLKLEPIDIKMTFKDEDNEFAISK